MGFFGKLFGKKGRRVPSWARDAFGDDSARFEEFVGLVSTALDGSVRDDGIRTGNVTREQGEWNLQELADTCAKQDISAWSGLIDRSLRGDASEAAGAASPRADRGEHRSYAWAMGTAAWGGATFECDDKKIVLVLLPIIDRAPYATLPSFPPGLIAEVLVCNGGTGGYLAATDVARAAGVDHVYAIDPDAPVDRGGTSTPTQPPVAVRPLTTLVTRKLTLERDGTGVLGRWNNGTRLMCGDAILLSSIAIHAPHNIIGKIIGDTPDATKLVGALDVIKKIVIVANVPGLDASALAQVLSALGLTSEIVNVSTPRRMQVFALMIRGELDRADALAAEAIAADDNTSDMHFQRAMIALMRGDDAAADHHLSKIDTPQSLTSRAHIAARKRDPGARALALRALAQLPGDKIAITAAIQVHATTGDPVTARALLAEHSASLDLEQRIVLEHMIDDPPPAHAHLFPEHARLAAEMATNMLDARRFADAEPILRRAHEWDPGNSAITADLGYVLSQQQRDADAIAIYDEAIDRGGTNTLLRFNRGNCRIRLQQFAAAAEDFRACLELESTWHDARVSLVSALHAAHDREGARRELGMLKELGGAAQLIPALEDMLQTGG